MAAVAISNLKFFGHVTVIGFNIWCSVPNLIKIGRFFTEIWRYNDFQNGGRPPSWILKSCSLFLSCVLCRYAILLPHTKCRWNRTIGRWVMAKKRFSRWRSFAKWRPSAILDFLCSFCHVALVDMQFCFFIQNSAEIGQSVDELWPKKRFSRWRPPPFSNLKISIFSHATGHRVQYLL